MMEEDLPAAHRVSEEIVDLIIDQCHSDHKALSVFALVSPSWLYMARRRLFAKVCLHEDVDDDDDDDDDLETDTSNSSASPQVPVDPLQRLNTGLEIIAASPEIASSIRTLHVYHDKRSYACAVVQKSFEFLSHLPRLRVLILAISFAKGLDRHNVAVFREGVIAIAPTLEKLVLIDVDFAHCVEFWDFVHAFPRLRELSLSSIAWREIPIAEQVPTSVFHELPAQLCKQPPCLERVILERCTPSQGIIIGLLHRDAFQLGLETIGLHWNRDLEANLPAYEKLFAVIGPALRSINLEVYHHPDASAMVRLLLKCQQLTSFSINIDRMMHGALHGDFNFHTETLCLFESILEALEESSSSHLQEFHICIMSLYSDPALDFFPGPNLT
ncbi:hypothetical protein BDZ89DRAFT_1134715 [Hymenopellis radicata]|nr:hypothetical protein BDZ89DRAFT_1134715 [Hymenopellis radicata]